MGHSHTDHVLVKSVKNCVSMEEKEQGVVLCATAMREDMAGMDLEVLRGGQESDFTLKQVEWHEIAGEDPELKVYHSQWAHIGGTQIINTSYGSCWCLEL